jgi:hypothetical protein
MPREARASPPRIVPTVPTRIPAIGATTIKPVMPKEAFMVANGAAVANLRNRRVARPILPVPNVP